MKLIDYAYLGKELTDTFVVDVHIHIGDSNSYHRHHTDADSVIRTMNRLGVDKVLCSHSPGAYGPWRWGNETAGQAHAKYPDRLLAYAVAMPYYPDTDWDDYFVRDDRFFGIKSVPFLQNMTPLDHPGLQSAYSYANEKGLPVLFHAWQPSEVEQGVRIAKAYPNAKFIFGHSAYTARSQAVEACRQCDNILLETTMSSPVEGDLEWIVGKVGADRVAYGSDLTAFSCAHILGTILMSRLSDTDKEKVLGLNARRFLGL